MLDLPVAFDERIQFSVLANWEGGRGTEFVFSLEIERIGNNSQHLVVLRTDRLA